MKRNCNLELRLVTPSVYSRSLDFVNGQFDSTVDMVGDGSSPNEEQMQQMTIFYGGKVATCDANELQARVILLLASQETKEKSSSSYSSGSNTPSPSVMSPAYSPSNGLYMKKSLQRFLQKRKTRALATSPYPTIQDHNN